jgi:hypothetical protein
MGPILVNTKQKIAVLAAGLVVATTGFVTDQAAVADQPAPVVVTHTHARPSDAGNERAGDHGGMARPTHTRGMRAPREVSAQQSPEIGEER